MSDRPSPAQPPRPEIDRDLAARLLNSLKQGNDVRAAKVTRMRTRLGTPAPAAPRAADAEPQFSAEDYENDLKLSVAADRLLESLREDASPRHARRPEPVRLR